MTVDRRRGGVLALAVLLLGCVGRQAKVVTEAGPAAPPSPADAGPAVFRRLTLFEYRNTLRDLLGGAPPLQVPVDTTAGKSGYAMGGWTSWVGTGMVLEATEELARRAVQRIDRLVPCAPIPEDAAGQSRCAERFIARFGRRAYRRPLAAEETRALLGLYTEQRSRVGQGFPDAIRVVMTAMLLSPRFLYHWERGPQPVTGALVRYDDHEMASRLSYLVWGSMPDEALFAAADAGRLQDPEEIARQVRRMLRDRRARAGMAEFYVQWLDLTQVPDLKKNKKRWKGYSAALAGSMLEETRALVNAVVNDGDGRLETLLTSSAASVDEPLAGLYELPWDRPAVAARERATREPTDDDQDEKDENDENDDGTSARPGRRTAIQLDPALRTGILTRPAFLAAHATYDQSHPVKRGVEVAQRVLCTDLPSPPDNVPPPPRPPAEGLSTRERFAEHGQNACATVCHDLFDPLGFAFEHYDGIGAYRREDGGKPVDASGDFMADGVEKHFTDAVDLVEFLSHSREVHDCMVKQWFRYALRRRELAADESSVARVSEAFSKTSDLRELVVGVASSPAFAHRRASTGEPVRQGTAAVPVQ